MLNSRDDSHPMKGHPGYQGDNLDYCLDIVQRVDSNHVKLLFDIYHVQIMHGDVIRRIPPMRTLALAMSTPLATPGAANWTNTRSSTTQPSCGLWPTRAMTGLLAMSSFPRAIPYAGCTKRFVSVPSDAPNSVVWNASGRCVIRLADRAQRNRSSRFGTVASDELGGLAVAADP